MNRSAVAAGPVHEAGHGVRRILTLLGAVLLGAALVVPPAAAAGAPTSQRAQGERCVQLVISPGALGGGTSSGCVPVADGADGLDVLRAGGHTLRFDDSGLVCAIDGRPATGCGEAAAGGYAFWSYWWRTDDGAWRYANRGPGAHDVPPTGRQAEGWAWNDGSGAEQGSRPPLVPYAETCPPAPAPPRAPAPKAPAPKAPAPKAPAPGNTPPRAVPAPPKAPGAQAPVANPPTARAPSTRTPTSRPSAPGTDPAGPSTPPSAAPSTSADPTGSSPTGGPSPSPAPGTTTSGAPPGVADTLTPQAFESDPGGTSSLVTGLGVSAGVVLLAVASIVARRRRGPDEAGSA